MTPTIAFKKLHAAAEAPFIGSEYAAGADLRAVEEVNIYPGEFVKVPTGIAVEIPNGYFGAIYPRSGMATKKGLRLANCVGVIDADYRGEILVAMYNDSLEVQTVAVGERIAQMVIQPYLPCNYEEVDELSDTERGAGGFGSTGVK